MMTLYIILIPGFDPSAQEIKVLITDLAREDQKKDN